MATTQRTGSRGPAPVAAARPPPPPAQVKKATVAIGKLFTQMQNNPPKLLGALVKQVKSSPASAEAMATGENLQVFTQIGAASQDSKLAKGFIDLTVATFQGASSQAQPQLVAAVAQGLKDAPNAQQIVEQLGQGSPELAQAVAASAQNGGKPPKANRAEQLALRGQEAMAAAIEKHFKKLPTDPTKISEEQANDAVQVLASMMRDNRRAAFQMGLMAEPQVQAALTASLDKLTTAKDGRKVLSGFARLFTHSPPQLREAIKQQLTARLAQAKTLPQALQSGLVTLIRGDDQDGAGHGAELAAHLINELGKAPEGKAVADRLKLALAEGLRDLTAKAKGGDEKSLKGLRLALRGALPFVVAQGELSGNDKGLNEAAIEGMRLLPKVLATPGIERGIDSDLLERGGGSQLTVLEMVASADTAGLFNAEDIVKMREAVKARFEDRMGRLEAAKIAEHDKRIWARLLTGGIQGVLEGSAPPPQEGQTPPAEGAPPPAEGAPVEGVPEDLPTADEAAAG